MLGSPANNFREQEPGTEADIASFCATTYDVTFPMLSKISVAGEDKHPLYAALNDARSEVVRDGAMRARWVGGRTVRAGCPAYGFANHRSDRPRIGQARLSSQVRQAWRGLLVCAFAVPEPS